MSAFSAEWLALREPADHAARDAALTRALADWAGRKETVRILDLGAGTGSNLRYLAPRLRTEQHWRLIDHDAALLTRLKGATTEWAAGRGDGVVEEVEGLRIQTGGHRLRVQWSRADLHGLSDGLFADGVDLMTASALLDLASEDWIARLAELCAERRCAALFALSYDGRARWQPALPEDALVRDRLNRHQRRDKGLGSALGPAAAERAAAIFEARGLRVQTARSDWRLGPESSALQEALVRGWAEAAAGIDPSGRDRLQAWVESRLEHLMRGDSRVRVGHLDLLALPRDT